MRIAVGIATVGRPQLLRAMLAELGHQSRLPDVTIVCAPTVADIGDLPEMPGLAVTRSPAPAG